MKLKEFVPLYDKIHTSVYNRESTAYAKRGIIERTILPMLGDRRIESINKVDIGLYIAALKEKGLGAKTINNHLVVLRHLLKEAVEHDVADKHVSIKAMSFETPELRALTASQAAAVVRAADNEPLPVWGAMVRFALVTGLRIGELRALNWDQRRTERGMPYMRIDRQCSDRTNKIGPAKGRLRSIPLGPRAIAVLDGLDSRAKAGLVFALPSVGPAVPLKYKRCDGAMTRISKRAGVEWCGWHTLRHTFATQLRSNKIPMADIQALMGHVDPRTTARYAHVITADLQTAIDSLG